MKIRKGWLMVMIMMILSMVVVPLASSGADNSAPVAPTNLRIVKDPGPATAKDVAWFKATLGHIATMKGEDVEKRRDSLIVRYNKEASTASALLVKESLPTKLDAKMDLTKYKMFAKPPTGGAVNKPQKTAEAK